MLQANAHALFARHMELQPCIGLGIRVVEAVSHMDLDNPMPTVVKCLEDLEIDGHVRVGKLGE